MNEEKCCHLKCKNGECPDIRVLKQGFEKWMRAFCERKYESDFSREMTRSVTEWIKAFSG